MTAVLLLTGWRHHLVGSDSDTLFHVLLGELMLQQGSLLTSEPTTYTYPDGPLAMHEWGAQLLLAALHRGLGLSGVAIFGAVSIGSAVGLLTAWLHRQGVGLVATTTTLTATLAVAVIHVHARPHVLTWAFVVGWVILLELLHQRRLSPRAWLMMSCGAMAVWVNVHGGFLFGFFVLAAYVLAALVRVMTGTPAERDEEVTWTVRFVMGCLLVLGASALNPKGLALHLHLLAVAGSSEMMGFVGDSAAPNLMQRPHLLLYTLAAFFLLVVGRKRPAPREWMLVFLLAAMALQSIRNFPVMAFAVAVILGPRLQLLLEADTPDSAWGQISAMLRKPTLGSFRAPSPLTGVLGFALVASTASLQTKVSPQALPVGAMDFVEEHSAALEPLHMFNSYNWGAYISWRHYPRHRTFINSWGDYHGTERVVHFMDVNALRPGWFDTFEQWDIRWIVYPPGHPLVLALRERGWVEVFKDGHAVILLEPSAAASFDE